MRLFRYGLLQGHHDTVLQATRFNRQELMFLGQRLKSWMEVASKVSLVGLETPDFPHVSRGCSSVCLYPDLSLL